MKSPLKIIKQAVASTDVVPVHIFLQHAYWHTQGIHCSPSYAPIVWAMLENEDEN